MNAPRSRSPRPKWRFCFRRPSRRRTLIHFKLLRSQLGIFFSALLFTLFSRRFGGNAWIHALGWWLILSTLNLHFLGSSFARTMLLDHGVSNRLRRLLVFGLAGASWPVSSGFGRKTRCRQPTAADRANFTALLDYAQLRSDRRPGPLSALSVSVAGASVSSRRTPQRF